MSTRDELAAALDFNSVPSFEPEFGQGRFFTPDMADALIAEGWRKKPTEADVVELALDLVTVQMTHAEATRRILAFMDRGQ